MLWNPANPTNPLQVKDTQAAASALGMTVYPVEVKGAGDLDRAFTAIKKDGAGALLVPGDPMFGAQAQRIRDAAAKNRLPVMYPTPEAGDSMFAALDGEVEIRKAGRVLETAGAGSVFGELELIDQEPRSAAAVVTRDCRVVAVGERRFTQLVQQTPYFALEIMHILADRLRRNTST